MVDADLLIIDLSRYSVHAVFNRWMDFDAAKHLANITEHHQKLQVVDGRSRSGYDQAEEGPTYPSAFPLPTVPIEKRQQPEKSSTAATSLYHFKPFELEWLYAMGFAGNTSVSKAHTDPKTADNMISKEYLFIKKGRALKKVLLKNIIYIEVSERYCNIVTEKEKFVSLISLKKMLTLLGESFCRTHRNHIVNLDHIEQIITVDNLIILTGCHHATLSEKYRSMLKKLRTLS